MQTESNKYPLVSIFSFVKNGAKSVKRSIDSILAQDYPYIEIIVQDGVSTDGTLEILKSYGDKINLVSESDSGPGDAFFRSLSRVRGEFFGSCLSDEELLPHAVSWAVKNLTENPELAAIYGDHYNTDCDGNITAWVKAEEWDYEKYICSEITPPFCSSFFRKSCYDTINLSQYTGCGEFEIWIRLGAKFPIRHIPCFISKYAVHSGEYGLRSDIREELMASRKAAIERFCNNPETPEFIRSLRDKAIASLYPWHVINYCNIEAWDIAKKYAPLAYKNGTNPYKLDVITERFQKQAVELEKKEQIEQALEYLDLLVQEGANRPNFNYRRANILFRLGRMKEAAQAGSEELKLQPDHYKSKAIIRLAQFCPEGIPQPNQDKIYEELLKMGIELMHDGNLQEAFEYFNEVRRNCPELPNLHFAVAAAYIQVGKLYLAKQACETEIKHQPEHSGAKSLLERLDKAIYEYEQSNGTETDMENECSNFSDVSRPQTMILNAKTKTINNLHSNVDSPSQVNSLNKDIKLRDITEPAENKSTNMSKNINRGDTMNNFIDNYNVTAQSYGSISNTITDNPVSMATKPSSMSSKERHMHGDFTDGDLWTPETYMRRAIRDWLNQTSFVPQIALSIDKNPPLDAIILRKWPDLTIHRAAYPEFDAQDLSRIPDNQYDLVYSNQILEHIPKPWVAAVEMVRVLKPGGLGLHTTCAFNPRHGPPAFNDYFRFLPDGLAELFEGVKVIVKAGWGNRQALLYNIGVDDGHGVLGGRRFCEQVGQRNDERYPWHVWIIFEKAAEMNSNKIGEGILQWDESQKF